MNKRLPVDYQDFVNQPFFFALVSLAAGALAAGALAAGASPAGGVGDAEAAFCCLSRKRFHGLPIYIFLL